MSGRQEHETWSVDHEELPDAMDEEDDDVDDGGGGAAAAAAAGGWLGSC